MYSSDLRSISLKKYTVFNSLFIKIENENMVKYNNFFFNIILPNMKM